MSKEITDKQIQEWKAKYGEVFMVSADDKAAYLRKADRKILSASRTLAGNDALKFNEVLLKNCFLGGDECFMDDDDYFLGIQTQLANVIVVKEVELKKL
jgi:hypothetical protein